MADITHNDSVVTESKLKDFYEDIKPFLGCPAYLTSEGNAEYYSTEEKVIGRWIDGKPLYQKSYQLPSRITLSTNSWYTIDSIDTTNLIIINGFGVRSDGVLYPIAISGLASGNKLELKRTTENPQIDYITIKYTKTTDSAATTVQSDPNEYSTDEKIIGKWIDGKPIYQKTITNLNMKLTWYSQNFAWTNYFPPLFSGVDSFIDAKVITESKSNIPASIEQYNGQWAIRGVLDGTIITLTAQYTKTTD